MTTYKQAGVDIAAGNDASKKAYEAALKTFSSRKGRIGDPVRLEGGFAGALDFGEYYLVMGADGVGTKITVALETNNLKGLGYDLLAMVADDAVCVGAEVIAVTNTFDTHTVEPEKIGIMAASLAQACREQKVVIPGGEIAELGEEVHSTTWNATAIGIVEKKKYITGHNIEPGDKIIALREYGLRSNGFSLARHICRQGNISYGDIFTGNQTWGEALLKPSVIYHDAVLQLIGRYGEPAKAQVSGIAHITGGGIAENLRRILKTRNTGARLDNLWNPPQVIQKLQELGSVTDEEAYKTWNMGNGMLIIIPEEEAESALNILKEAKNIEARVAGEVTKKTEIVLKMWR